MILPEPLVVVVAIDRQGEDVAGYRLRRRAYRERWGRWRCRLCRGCWGRRGGEAGAGLVREARPGHAVGETVVAVVADGGEEALAYRVPDDRGCGVASGVEASGLRGLHGLAAVQSVAMCQVTPASVE